MRTVLFILLASASALVLAALFAGRDGGRTSAVRTASLVQAALLPVPRLAMPHLAMPPAPHPPPSASAPAMPGLPLTERTLSQAERGEPVSAEMQEAVGRIEPVFDPTRLDGPFTSVPLRIWPGTASMTDVFGEHWHLASDDPNVHLKVHASGLAWLGFGRAPTGLPPCDAFTRNRPHPLGETTLAELSAADCSRLRQRQARRFDDAAPVPVVSAPTSVPVFAAPPPGARMSSRDFWAAQQARIAAARAYLQRKWQAARAEPAGDPGLRR